MVAAAIPFVCAMNPGARTRSAGAPVDVVVSKLEPGQQIIMYWRGKPVLVSEITAVPD